MPRLGTHSWIPDIAIWYPEKVVTMKQNRKCVCNLQSLESFLISVAKGSTILRCSVQSLSHIRLFEAPWTAARQASLSITNSGNFLKPESIESVMPSNHLILCHTLLLPPSIFPSIRVFSNESALCIRWPVLEFQLQHQSFQ